MRRVLVVSTPAILEARNLAAWITRERIPGVRIAPSRGEWGVFAPASHAERARRAFRKVVAANNPGGYRVYFKLRHQDKYKPVRKVLSFGRATAIADLLVKRLAVKAAVLDRRGKVRFVAFQKNANGRVLTNSPMDKLADVAVMMAARGARAYLDAHKLTADPAALTACLKSWVKIKFPEALNDVRAAISAGMHAVAEQTFAATMRMAGIEAAKEAARAPGTNSRHRSNPHAQVPLELRGQAYASRFAGYLRKRGVRCSMKAVADRPGWWAFFVRPSQLQKAEALEWEWMRVSDPAETKRMEIKGHAAFRRWRRRVQRRPHRRGSRKEGYFRGGVLYPHRSHRNPGEYIVEHKSDIMEVGWIRYGSHPTEAKARESMEYLMFSGHDEGMPDDYVARVTLGGRTIAQRFIKDWRSEKKRPRPRPMNNRPASRNPRRQKIVGWSTEEGKQYCLRCVPKRPTGAYRILKGHPDWSYGSVPVCAKCRQEIPTLNENPRRARRNVRSYKRNGVMTSDEAWAAMQWLYKNDKARYQIARRKTVDYLIERRGPDSPYGISSSDVNHTMVSLIVQGDITMPSGAPWRKQVRKNVSIESKWPRMTDRQRREALRIIGIGEDIAELWSDRSWDRLSSVVRQLLVRSWKHGGDTTKIRRVPVGAR